MAPHLPHRAGPKIPILSSPIQILALFGLFIKLSSPGNPARSKTVPSCRYGPFLIKQFLSVLLIRRIILQVLVSKLSASLNTFLKWFDALVGVFSGTVQLSLTLIY